MIREFCTAFVRPMTGPVAVAGFMLGANVRGTLVAAACVGMYFVLLEVGRQGDWK